MKFRPFPFVIVTAIALVGLKITALFIEERRDIAQLDMIQTGSIGKKQPSPLASDDIFVRALSSMPAKEAARVFSGLELSTQAEIAPRLSATLLGDILSEMPPEKAEKLAIMLFVKK
jgi:flagellar motility protein MotE (MotC chaperone)